MNTSQQSCSTNSLSFDSLKNFHHISPVVQNHIKHVYVTLGCGVVVSAIGAFIHVSWNIGGFLTTLTCFVTMVWLLCTHPLQEQKSVCLLMASALFYGVSIVPLIDLVIVIDSSLIITAFVGASLAFACFSVVASVARHREYLYIGGLLSILIWLHFASSVFGGPIVLLKFQMYLGLLVFVGYVVIDTEEIIERAHSGDLDYVKHICTNLVP